MFWLIFGRFVNHGDIPGQQSFKEQTHSPGDAFFGFPKIFLRKKSSFFRTFFLDFQRYFFEKKYRFFQINYLKKSVFFPVFFLKIQIKSSKFFRNPFLAKRDFQSAGTRLGFFKKNLPDGGRNLEIFTSRPVSKPPVIG